MTDLDLHEIDPSDEPALRAWWEVGHASSAERPFDAWPAWEVSRVALPRPRPDSRVTLLAAVEGGTVVGTALLNLFLLDNTHLAEVDVQVLPEHRRRGVGTRLLREVEERVHRAGRTTLIATVHAPVGAESPGSSFAATQGYPVGSHEETKLVDLAAAVPTWARLDEKVAARLNGYRVEGFEGRVPAAYVEDFCDLLSAFMEAIPTGDLDLRQEAWTPQRLHEHEERARDIGEGWVVAVAVTPQGRLCGFSELGIAQADPRHASVGGTLVLPGHRGHGLGLAMKLSTHRRVLELYPECGYVQTGNAGVNAPMNAVNEQLGYRVVERCLDVQKVL